MNNRIVYWLLARFPRPLVVAISIAFIAGLFGAIVLLGLGLNWISKTYPQESMGLLVIGFFLYGLLRLAHAINDSLPRRKPKD